MNVSIVVPAHNEAANIRRLLTALLEQQTRVARIVEIVVVASGCTDDTAEVAREFGRGRPGLHVHVQERREGKVAAINAYLKMRDPRADVTVVLQRRPRPGAATSSRRWSCALSDHPEVGMVGGRPVPDNDPASSWAGWSSLLWELHHRVSLEVPKMGEIVAFRAHLVEYVSELSVVDEASIEDIVRAKGYKLGYVPDADRDQPRARAHGGVLRACGAAMPAATTGSLRLRLRGGDPGPGAVAKAVLDTAREQDRFGKVALAAAVGVEIAARALGFWDARIVGGKHRTWKTRQSTKTLGAPARGADAAPAKRAGTRLSARPGPNEGPR